MAHFAYFWMDTDYSMNCAMPLQTNHPLTAYGGIVTDTRWQIESITGAENYPFSRLGQTERNASPDNINHLMESMVMGRIDIAGPIGPAVIGQSFCFHALFDGIRVQGAILRPGLYLGFWIRHSRRFLSSAHPQMANLSDTGVARKT